MQKSIEIPRNSENILTNVHWPKPVYPFLPEIDDVTESTSRDKTRASTALWVTDGVTPSDTGPLNTGT